MKNLIQTIQYTYTTQGSLGKTWQLYRREFLKNGIFGLKALWLRQNGESKFQQWKSKTQKYITIIATPHTVFITKLLSQALDKVGLSYQIKIGRDFKYFDDSFHIVICPQIFKKLPKSYIAFQMEQTVSDRWFGQKDMQKLQQALLVMDYSLHNISYLNQRFPLSHIYYTPISPIDLASESSDDHEYDVLFYGDTNNQRRKIYLDALQKKFKVKIINNAFGEEIWDAIRKAKVVINIHYYESALLETTRLYECLSNHALVISEKSSDFEQHTDLCGLVDFVEIGDVEHMLTRVQHWKEQTEIYLEQKSRIKEYVQKDQNLFNFYFYRVLLSLELIDFNTLYLLTNQTWNPTSNFWCLGLPESTERQAEFHKEQNKIPNIWSFPGIRHKTPWIGCGLSYKYMLRYARDHQWNNISICEDDVLFPDNIQKKLEDIHHVLDDKSLKWDIFSGHVTDLNTNTNIQLLDTEQSTTYVQLSKTTGMVFNIYHQRFYDYLLKWDENNHDLKTNAIDRYIENKPDLKVVTTLPYLVEHKENVCTTLWNRKHTTHFSYHDMTHNSIKVIQDKISKT